MYLGISPQYKGYKCLSKTGKVYISKDVIFHEHLYPYQTLSPFDAYVPNCHDCTFESIPFPSFKLNKAHVVTGPSSLSNSSLSVPVNDIFSSNSLSVDSASSPSSLPGPVLVTSSSSHPSTPPLNPQAKPNSL